MGGRVKYKTEEERQEAIKASRRKYNKSAKGRAAMKDWYEAHKELDEFKAVRNTRQQEYREQKTEQERIREKARGAELTRLRRRHNPLKHLLYDAKKRAKQKGMEFSVTEEDISIPDFCPVLGIPLCVADGKRSANSPSIDRFDNTKGYTIENSRVISLRANTLKNDATLEEMEKIVLYMKGEL